MGLLLMEFEYQRAKQDLNGDQLQGIRLNSQLKTYTKRLETITSIFAKKKTQIESKWNRASSELGNQISMASVNPKGFDALNSMTISGIATSTIGTMLGAAKTASTETTGTQQADAKTQQQNQYTQVAAAAAQLKSDLQTLIEQLKDAETDRLEEQEDMQKEPIAEKQADFDSKKTTNEVLTEFDENRVKSAEPKLPDQVKSSTAHYGLQG